MDETETLDVRGLRCPLPVLKAEKRLERMRKGARLVLVTDDPISSVDVPHFCREKGHRLCRTERQDDIARFEIERG